MRIIGGKWVEARGAGGAQGDGRGRGAWQPRAGRMREWSAMVGLRATASLLGPVAPAGGGLACISLAGGSRRPPARAHGLLEVGLHTDDEMLSQIVCFQVFLSSLFGILFSFCLLFVFVVSIVLCADDLVVCGCGRACSDRRRRTCISETEEVSSCSLEL